MSVWHHIQPTDDCSSFRGTAKLHLLCCTMRERAVQPVEMTNESLVHSSTNQVPLQTNVSMDVSAYFKDLGQNSQLQCLQEVVHQASGIQ